MTCEKCLRFPAPPSTYDEVAVNEVMQSELYRCRACGQLLKIFALDRAVYYLSQDEARDQFPRFDPSNGFMPSGGGDDEPAVLDGDRDAPTGLKAGVLKQ